MTMRTIRRVADAAYAAGAPAAPASPGSEPSPNWSPISRRPQRPSLPRPRNTSSKPSSGPCATSSPKKTTTSPPSSPKSSESSGWPRCRTDAMAQAPRDDLAGHLRAVPVDLDAAVDMDQVVLDERRLANQGQRPSQAGTLASHHTAVSGRSWWHDQNPHSGSMTTRT
jgi:hypothetical protein